MCKAKTLLAVLSAPNLYSLREQDNYDFRSISADSGKVNLLRDSKTCNGFIPITSVKHLILIFLLWPETGTKKSFWVQNFLATALVQKHVSSLPEIACECLPGF